MWRSKKFVIIALMVVIVVAGSIGGVALAQSDDEEVTPPKASGEALLEKVCEIYNDANPEAPIDCEALQAAFDQAREQINTQAREQFRQRLIEEGKITQEQLDELDKWLEARPDFPTDEYKEWMESRPDVPFAFGPGNNGGFKAFGDGHRGFGKFGGGFPRFGGACTPDSETN
jgi:hypothetical protein